MPLGLTRLVAVRGSARFGAAQPFVSAHGQRQQGQNEILRCRRCGARWVRAVSAGEGQSWWGSGCPVRCREHKGMWCCKAPQHQGSPVPAPCHSSCSARCYQPSMSPHCPFSWCNDWVWRFQGITAPAFPMGALQGTAQVLRPPKDGAKDWQMPHTNLPAAPQQSTGTSTGSKPVSAPGSLSVASLDPTASQVASSASVQPWARDRKSVV